MVSIHVTVVGLGGAAGDVTPITGGRDKESHVSVTAAVRVLPLDGRWWLRECGKGHQGHACSECDANGSLTV